MNMDAIRAMNFRLFRTILAAGVLAAFLSGTASAHDYRVGSLRIDHPWATATPQGAKVGAGYVKIVNDGTQPDRLMSITSPVSGKVTIHESVQDGDIVKMRPLVRGLEIKPGETVELKPQGYHIMFEDLKAPLVAKVRAKGTLVFEKAGSIDVEFAVEPIGTRGSDPAAHSHTHQ